MVWNVTVAHQFLKPEKAQKRIVNMPEITVYLVQYPLKLFLSSKKQNYLVKDSQLQV